MQVQKVLWCLNNDMIVPGPSVLRYRKRLVPAFLRIFHRFIPKYVGKAHTDFVPFILPLDHLHAGKELQ